MSVILEVNMKCFFGVLFLIQVVAWGENGDDSLTEEQKTSLIQKMVRSYNVHGGEKTWKSDLFGLLAAPYDEENEIRMQILISSAFRTNLFIEKWSYDEMIDAITQLSNILHGNMYERYRKNVSLTNTTRLIVKLLHKYQYRLKRYKEVKN